MKCWVTRTGAETGVHDGSPTWRKNTVESEGTSVRHDTTADVSSVWSTRTWLTLGAAVAVHGCGSRPSRNSTSRGRKYGPRDRRPKPASKENSDSALLV